MEDLVIDIDFLFPSEQDISDLLKKIESGKDLTFDEILTLKKLKLVGKIIKSRGLRI